MAYAPTDWVDNVTPVDEAHMDKIEQGIVSVETLANAAQTAASAAGSTASAAVPKDGAVVAATRVLTNKLLSGDAQPSFRILGDGKIEWGPGGATVPDTNFYRAGVNSLLTDSDLSTRRSLYAGSGLAAGGWALYSNIAGDAQVRFFLTNQGAMSWGPGNAGPDTNLYRAAADRLATDDQFWALNEIRAFFGTANQVTIGDPASPKIYFGSAFDTNLYRAAADVLKTDDVLAIGGELVTTLPASPVDGQVAVLTNSLTAPTYSWRFRYNAGSSSAYKWEFIGGAPLTVQSETAQTVTGASFGDLSPINSITLPRAGDYFCGVAAGYIGHSAAGNSQCYISINAGGVEVYAANLTIPQTQQQSGGRQARFNGLAASSVVKMRGGLASGTMTVNYTTVWAIPIRVS